MNTPKLLLTLSVIAGIAGCSVLTKPNEAEEANKSEMLLAKARRDQVDSSPNVRCMCPAKCISATGSALMLSI